MFYVNPECISKDSHHEGFPAEVMLLIKSMQGMSEYQAMAQLRQQEDGVVIRRKLYKTLRGTYSLYPTTTTITKLKLHHGIRYFLRDNITGFSAQLTATKMALVMSLTGMRL